MAAPLIGRDAELARLLQCAASAAAGAGGFAAISGEAGIGKTRLVEEFRARLSDRVAVLHGGALDDGWAAPFHVWAEALDSPAVAAIADDLGAEAAVIHELLPRRRATAEPPVLSPPAARERIFDAVTHMLLRVAEERPLAVILEDLHVADEDTLALLAHVAQFVRRTTCLVVVTHRDPPGAALELALAAARRAASLLAVPLRPLDRSEAAALIGAYCGTRVSADLGDRLLAESGGIPFYLLALVDHILDTSRGDDLHEAVPAGVRHVVRARLARLDAPCAAILAWAALAPARITPSALAAIAAVEEDVALAALQTARQAGFIRAESAAVWSFAHALVRRAILDAEAPERRAVMYKTVAERMEQVAGTEPAVIAGHYWMARGLAGSERGVRWCERAADEATRRGAHAFAVNYRRMAADLAGPLDAPRRAEVLARAALAEAAALRFERALDTLGAAERALDELADAQSGRVALLTALVDRLKEGGAAPALWEPPLHRALAIAEPGSLAWARLVLLTDRTETLIAADLRLGHWTGSEPAAVAVAMASRDEADIARATHPLDVRDRAGTDRIHALGRASVTADALRFLDACIRDFLYRQRDVRAALVALREMLARSEALGAVPTQAEALLQLAAAHIFLGEAGLAREAASQAGAVIARLGPQHRLHVLATIAEPAVRAYTFGGDWVPIGAQAEALLASGRLARQPVALMTAGFAALAHAEAGATERARERIHALTGLLGGIAPDALMHGLTLDLLVAAVHRLGERALAEPLIAAARAADAAARGGLPVVTAALSHARLCALTSAGGAAKIYARAEIEANALGLAPAAAIAHFERAVLECAPLANAVKRFQELEMGPWVARAGGVAATAPSGLTTRESDVVRLIAAGRSNKEIARGLGISVATVERHIANVYGKLGLRGRAQATAWAIRNRLAP